MTFLPDPVRNVDQYSSIAALKSCRLPLDGTIVSVSGYYAAGDGGGGQFYYDEDATDDDNGGTIIEPTAGVGRWKRIYSGAVDVKWFGARGDNSTDDTAAMQSAVNQNCSVFIPKGRYRITSALNVTNKAVGPLTFFGEGWDENGNGSVIYAETSGIAIDCTGSQFLSFRDLSVVSQGRANPSTIGLLFARATSPAKEYCQYISLYNVFIDITSNMTAYGGLGTVAVYNKAAEIHEYRNLYARADTPLVVVGHNTWNVSSPYQTINTSIISTSQITLSGSSALISKSPSAQCAYMRDAFGIELQNAYLWGAGTGVGSYAIYSQGTRRLRVSCHIEGCDRVAYLRDVNDTKIEATIDHAYAYSPIYLGTTFTIISKLDLNIELVSGAITTWPYAVEGHYTSYLEGLTANIGTDDGTITLTNVVNVQGSFRKVRSLTLKKGGFKDLHLVGTPLCETWMNFDAQSAASVPNNSLFRDSADGKLKYKDNLGAVNQLY